MDLKELKFSFAVLLFYYYWLFLILDLGMNSVERNFDVLLAAANTFLDFFFRASAMVSFIVLSFLMTILRG